MASINQCHLISLLNEIKSVIAFDQPKLSATLQNNLVLVDGVFRVLQSTGKFAPDGAIAEYRIHIEFDVAFPEIEPKVFETDKAIIRDGEHHINPDGSCCTCVWEVWIATDHDISVQDYFDGPLKNFFLSQYVKRTTGKWPFGEEKHGKVGFIDAAARLLGCDNNEIQVRRLLKSLSQDCPRGDWDCPCGSGLTIRKCCSKERSELSKRIPPKNARRMLERLDFI